MRTSTYADYADSLKKLGFDCSKLTVEQMDEVGMAAERAWLDWDWAAIDLANEVDEDRIRRIHEAREAVKCCDAESEDELVGRYVGIFFDDWGL